MINRKLTPWFASYKIAGVKWSSDKFNAIYSFIISEISNSSNLKKKHYSNYYDYLVNNHQLKRIETYLKKK